LQEILGGRHDGKTGWSGFDFDLSQLLEGFAADHVGVSTGRKRRPSEVVLEGSFRGKKVRLHLGLRPPEGAEVSEVIDLLQPGGATVREKG
jgi:hypothetical protein